VALNRYETWFIKMKLFSPETEEDQLILDGFSAHLNEYWLDTSLHINAFSSLVQERILYLVSLDLPAYRFLEGIEGSSEINRASIKYQENNVCREAADFIQTGDSRVLDFSNRIKRNSYRGLQRLRSRSLEKISIQAAEAKFGFPFIARFFKEEDKKIDYYHASTVIGRREDGVYEEFYKHGTIHSDIRDVVLPPEGAGFSTFEPILR